MLLADLFSYISTLDSSSINIGGDDNGDIASNHYPKVINAINLAMIDLYTEFPVKVRGMTIQLYSHITEYYLDSDYAATNTESTEVYKYITDTANNPFTDDVIHIVQHLMRKEKSSILITKKNPCPFTLLPTTFFNTLIQAVKTQYFLPTKHFRLKFLPIPM